MKLLAGFEMGKISLMLDLVEPLTNSYARKSRCRQASAGTNHDRLHA